MKNQVVRNLMLSQGSDSPYVEELRRCYYPKDKSLSPAQRLAYPMINPRFENDFASAYAQKKETLPAQVAWSSLWRIYSHLRYGEELKYLDPAGCEAISLADPLNRAAQELIEGLLCAGLDYQQVARSSGRSVEVIQLYSCWFFDFLARKEDRTFVTSVLNPDGELSVVGADSTPDSLVLARRVGYEQGSAALLRIVRSERIDSTKTHRSSDISQVLLRRAEIKAKLGLLKRDDPEFAIVKMQSAVQANQPQSNFAARAADWIASNKACQAMFKQYSERSCQEKIKAAQAYDAHQAAEALKKAMDKRP